MALVSFGQEFQFTLTGVNRMPNVHLGLGVEIPEKKFPKIEQLYKPERREAIGGEWDDN